MFSAATKTGSQPSAAYNYIEDVFSTYLYTGNGSTQTITNDIDLAGEGGMTWIKVRNTGGYHALVDTVRGASKILASNATDAQYTDTAFTSFNSNGFTVADDPDWYTNRSGQTYASWTFRKQPKFFDVVTYTGDSNNSHAIAHSLGSQPGMIIIKATSTTSGWDTYARNGSTTYAFLRLNETSAAYSTTVSQTSAASSTNLNVGWLSANVNGVNDSGVTYVAYLFAHDAGGFGTSGTDNVISCGSFTTDGSGAANVSLGYEPQFVLIKKYSSGTQDWHTYDVMRGFNLTGTNLLRPNTSGAESVYTSSYANPTATGFNIPSGLYSASESFIYMAIRRPMKVPTDATTVFSPNYASSTAPTFRSTTITQGLDSVLTFYTPGYNDGTNAYPEWFLRLTGSQGLQTANTRPINDRGSYATWDYMNGFYNYAGLSISWGSWNFARRPGFHDVVCGTLSGTGSYQTGIAHNLGVVPELTITKLRSTTSPWGAVYVNLGKKLVLNSDESSTTANTTLNLGVYTVSESATSFWLRRDTATYNGNGFVTYLFATCPGVSKVGSYTGTGATQTINCGFTGGARFVLIKRTDSTGDWYVWDTTRGMTAGTDPSLTLNTYNAEVNANSVYTATTGFSLLASPSADVNTSGGNYIYLAIA